MLTSISVATGNVGIGLLAAAFFAIPAAVAMTLFGLAYVSNDVFAGWSAALAPRIMQGVQLCVSCAATALVACGALKLKATLVKTKVG